MKKENSLWFSRFERYRLMGPNRSMLQSYNLELQEKAEALGKKPKVVKSLSTYWHEKAEQFQWAKRCEAWDNYNLELRRKEIEERHQQELAQVRAIRGQTIQALQGMLGQVLMHQQKMVAENGHPHIDPKNLKDLAMAAALIFKESRLEFGEPTEISDTRTSVSIHGLKDLFQIMGAKERHERRLSS